MIEVKSFCRFCMPFCGTRLTLDDDGNLLSVRGDKDDPMTQGYTCIKGLHAPATHAAPDRIMTPLKRLADGSFVAIGFEQALDEIAVRLRTIIERDGPEAVAGFRGSGGALNASSALMLQSFLQTLGSPKYFTTVTIDQSAKIVTVGRLGMFGAPAHPLVDSDVRLIVGANPLVALANLAIDHTNPTKTLRDAKARGLKLIVIDPRRSETARHADLFLQPFPGEDPTIIAGLLRIILVEGWEDREFCERFVSDMDGLRRMVDPFTPAYVQERADVAADDLFAAAAMFARDSRRGFASAGTGPSMAPYSNLTDHLVETLNVVCGRYQREGEQVANPGFLRARYPRRAQVIGPTRSWETGFRSRIGGYGMFYGEMMSGIMCDEILEPGPGQVRALFVHGANVANTMPDQEKTVRALSSLELLVSIEPFMNETATLSDYVLPVKLGYERADLTIFVYESIYSRPFARYAAPVVRPPAGSELVDDWEVFWGLARRLDVALSYDDLPLDMQNKPTTDGILAGVARFAPVPWEEFKSNTLGMFASEPQFVEPAEAGATDRFAVTPEDVVKELAAVFDNPPDRQRYRAAGKTFTHLLISRRLREVVNSCHRNVPAIRARMPQNYAYLHPTDLADLGAKDGDMIEIASDNGTIPAAVAADPDLKRGVVSMSHGWGALPGRTDYIKDGSNTGLLISTSRDRASINAMPRMSAIPVNVAVLSRPDR